MIRVVKRDELYHHGILGQKWGKRNGPPYPLDAEDHSAAEKRAAKSGKSDKPKKKSILTRAADSLSKVFNDIDKDESTKKVRSFIDNAEKELTSMGKELWHPSENEKLITTKKDKEQPKQEEKKENTTERSDEAYNSILEKNGYKNDDDYIYSKELPKYKNYAGSESKPETMIFSLNDKWGHASEKDLSPEDFSKLIKEVERDSKQIEEAARKYIVDEKFNSSYKPWIYDEDNFKGMPIEQMKQDFAKRLGYGYQGYSNKMTPHPIGMIIDHSGYMQISYADGGSYFGHVLTAEYDPKTKKFTHVSVDG